MKKTRNSTQIAHIKFDATLKGKFWEAPRFDSKAVLGFCSHFSFSCFSIEFNSLAVEKTPFASSLALWEGKLKRFHKNAN